MLHYFFRPAAVVVIAGTGAGAVAHVTGSASGTVADVGTAAGSFRSVTGSATGFVGAGGSAAGSLSRLTGSASGAVADSGSGAGSLRSITGSATGATGSASGAGTLRSITGAASGAVSDTGTAAGSLRSITGAASGSAGQAFASGTLHSITGSATGVVADVGTGAGTLKSITGSTGDVPDPALTDCGDDLMSRGMAWLASRQQSAMSQPIVYRRDTSAIAICATVGRTLFKLADEDGGIRMEWSDRDYLITTADLVLSGSATLPQRGDLIKQSVGGTLYTYEVLAPGGEPPWRWSDTYFNRVRVHTKLVTRGPAS